MLCFSKRPAVASDFNRFPPMRFPCAIMLLALTSLAGCASPVPATHMAAVKPATNEQVKACADIDDIVGASGWYGIYASKGIENARSEALHKAAAVGASHIVWNEPTLVYGSTSVSAKAYHCPTA